MVSSSTSIGGRYALRDPIAAGGMATVHLGRLLGPAGFSRTVAIKRLHPHLAVDASFADMFVDEARLAARVRHPNVVPTLDVLSSSGELLLVMEYVDGDSLSQLWKQARGKIPVPIAIAIVTEMLHGLHAAHEATSENGSPLGIVHRDVSPQNVLVGADGVARLVDFGVARAAGRLGSTADGDIKGKLAYMAPEQIRRETVTRRTDIFAAGIVLWELLTGERLFATDSEAATLEKILVGWIPTPSSIVRDLPPELDAIVLRALDPQPSMRFASAREMAVALEDAVPRALGRDVAEWVETTAKENLRARRALVTRVEQSEEVSGAIPAPPPTVDPTEELLTRPLMMAFERNEHTVVLPLTAPVKAQPLVRRIAVFVGSAALVVLASLHFAHGKSATVAATRDDAPIPVPVPPVEVASADVPAAPAASVTIAAKEPAPVSTVAVAPAPKPIARAQARRSVAPAKQPTAGCVGRYDPTTKKTIYVGDCE